MMHNPKPPDNSIARQSLSRYLNPFVCVPETEEGTHLPLKPLLHFDYFGLKRLRAEMEKASGRDRTKWIMGAICTDVLLTCFSRSLLQLIMSKK